MSVLDRWLHGIGPGPHGEYARQYAAWALGTAEDAPDHERHGLAPLQALRWRQAIDAKLEEARRA